MTIHKVTLTYTFLFDDTINPVAEVEEASLEAIVRECDEGHMMGRYSNWDSNPVPNEQVAAEEIALGGDGTFFADPDELEHARMDAEDDEERPDRDCDPDCSRRFSPAAECDCSRSK